jgi:hypothetical protein
MKAILATALTLGFGSAALAQAQIVPSVPVEKPTVAKYLADGYEVLRAEIGSPFLQFILQKKTAAGHVLVWCSVQVQTGETSSCRAIK